MTTETTVWAEALADADRCLAVHIATETGHGPRALAAIVRHLAAVVHHTRLLAIGAGEAASVIRTDLCTVATELAELAHGAKTDYDHALDHGHPTDDSLRPSAETLSTVHAALSRAALAAAGHAVAELLYPLAQLTSSLSDLAEQPAGSYTYDMAFSGTVTACQTLTDHAAAP